MGLHINLGNCNEKETDVMLCKYHSRTKTRDKITT